MEPTAAASTQDTHRTKSRHCDPKYGQGCKTAIIWTFLFILAASLLSPLTLVLVSAHSTLSVFSCSLLLFTVHFFGWLSPTCTPSPPLLAVTSASHISHACIVSTFYWLFIFLLSRAYLHFSRLSLNYSLLSLHITVSSKNIKVHRNTCLKSCVNLSIPVVIQPPP